LGNTKEGARLALESIEGLEHHFASDPADGQTRRFLLGSLLDASEVLRRDGNFKQAAECFDRLTELNSKTVKPNLMTSHIAVVVGLKDYPWANRLLDEYSPKIMAQQRGIQDDEIRLDESEPLANAITCLDNSSEIESAPVRELRQRLVGLTCQLLHQHVSSSDDQIAALRAISGRKDLAIMLSEEEFEDIVESR
jgi:hypothetical protein